MTYEKEEEEENIRIEKSCLVEEEGKREMTRRVDT